jgi:hypothetical protein
MEDMGCSGFNLRHAVGMRQIQLSEVSTGGVTSGPSSAVGCLVGYLCR